MNAVIQTFFDEPTFTYSYVVSDPETKHAAIIDSVMDYDHASGRISYQNADAIIAYVREQALDVQWILETHVHADHLSAAPYLRQALGGKMAIGEHITTVQSTFGKLFNAGVDFSRDGSQFDHLFKDGDHFQIGGLQAKALHTPGHTPACMTYVIDDSAFVGDTLFMPDFGTARCDFPGGDAEILYQSVQKLFALPESTKLYMCHDYKAPGRDHYLNVTTVKEQKEHNVHVAAHLSKDDFIKMRSERDATLAMPRLILPSVQINMRAGELPPAEDNGTRYIKIPINKV